MGRFLDELRAWEYNPKAAESLRIKPPQNWFEEMVVRYHRSHICRKVIEVLSPSPASRVKKHIQAFNKRNGTDFKNLHDARIIDLKIKRFDKKKEECDPEEPCGLTSIYPPYIQYLPPEIQERLIPKNNPGEPRSCYIPLDMMSTHIASFMGKIKLLSPLFGDSEKTYNIKINVVQYFKEDVDATDIQIYIYDSEIPVTDYSFGVDLTNETHELAKELRLFYSPNYELLDSLQQVPQPERKHGIYEILFQAMHRLRENVKGFVSEFLETNVISPGSVLTCFDNARVKILFNKPPKDERPEILQQIHEGNVDGRFFYLGNGAEVYGEACRSSQYVYSNAERELLDEHGKTAVESLSPELVISLGCGSGEKEHELFEGNNLKPRFIGIDSSPAMLAFFVDNLKTINPEIETIYEDLSDTELPDYINEKTLYTFLGNTLGNFSLEEQIRVLARINQHAKEGDTLMLGVSKFNPQVDNPDHEYDESASEFVTGVLSQVDLKGRTASRKRFDIEQKTHYVLVTFNEDCEVEIDGKRHEFKKGEQAKLIQSKRYTKEEIEELMRVSGFENFEIFENEFTFLVKAVK